MTVWLTDGTIAGQLRTPGFVLVRAPGTPRVLTRIAQVERRDQGPSLLIRPDGYVAWAGTGDGWRAVLALWAPAASEPPAKL
jgi:hypothetical protein